VTDTLNQTGLGPSMQAAAKDGDTTSRTGTGNCTLT